MVHALMSNNYLSLDFPGFGEAKEEFAGHVQPILQAFAATEGIKHHQELMGLGLDHGPNGVAGRGAKGPRIVAKNGQARNVQFSTSNGLVRLGFAADAEQVPVQDLLERWRTSAQRDAG